MYYLPKVVAHFTQHCSQVPKYLTWVSDTPRGADRVGSWNATTYLGGKHPSNWPSKQCWVWLPSMPVDSSIRNTLEGRNTPAISRLGLRPFEPKYTSYGYCRVGTYRGCHCRSVKVPVQGPLLNIGYMVGEKRAARNVCYQSGGYFVPLDCRPASIPST